MSFESRFENKIHAAEEKARLQRARKVEKGSSSDNDGSSHIDPLITSTKGQRPFPEGLVIHLDERSEAALADTSWQDELGELEEILRLNPKFNGEQCGILSGRFIVKKDPYDESRITDRYVHLGNVEVKDTTIRQSNLRRQGIGSALLAEMERLAGRFGASRIEGIISSIDLKETPSLPSFYENRGYQLTPKGAGFTMVKPL